MIQAKQELLAALGAAVQQLAPDTPFTPAFESPKQAAHGDFAITAAMQLAKAAKRNPRELATALVEALNAQPAGKSAASARFRQEDLLKLAAKIKNIDKQLGRTFA